MVKVLSLSIFADKLHRDSLKSIDQGEEELMNEKVMMRRGNLWQFDHQINQDLTKGFLTCGLDARGLEE